MSSRSDSSVLIWFWSRSGMFRENQVLVQVLHEVKNQNHGGLGRTRPDVLQLQSVVLKFPFQGLFASGWVNRTDPAPDKRVHDTRAAVLRPGRTVCGSWTLTEQSWFCFWFLFCSLCFSLLDLQNRT